MEERKYCVYKHTSPSGKVYIGITHKLPNARWQNGKGYKKHPHFYNAILKYGWENIQHEILCDGLSKSEAEQQEKHFIDLYQATNRDFGYNMTLGGECGAKFTDEVKEKISQSLKEYYKSTPGVLAKCSERQRGRHHSDETRRKMSESHRAMMADERRAMISASQFGRKYPDRVGHTKPSVRLVYEMGTLEDVVGDVQGRLAVINGVMPLKITTTGKSYKTRMTDKSVKNRKHGRGN